MTYSALKTLIDRVVSFVAFVLLMPLMVVIAILIYVFMGRPIIFSQTRPGLRGIVFTIYKFRTMSGEYREYAPIQPDGERLTSLGRVLRKTSLDELPQLWNILKGDMSFVGPRPLLVSYLELYNSEQARRHEVKPGITGLAQVKGRNLLTWDERFKLDVWYVDHCGFWLDLKILVMTLGKVVLRRGVSQLGHETVERFTGNLPRD